MLIISDTTPIISLIKAGHIGMLQELFEQVLIPEAVYLELTSNPKYKSEARIVQENKFLSVVPVSNKRTVAILEQVAGLDVGESEAIILADEQKADLLIIDEKRGRKVAKQMGISITGTLGVLMAAYDENILNAEEVDNCLQKLKDNDIRISESLFASVHKHIGM